MCIHIDEYICKNIYIHKYTCIYINAYVYPYIHVLYIYVFFIHIDKALDLLCLLFMSLFEELPRFCD
jgi:hypothetical protein